MAIGVVIKLSLGVTWLGCRVPVGVAPLPRRLGRASGDDQITLARADALAYNSSNDPAGSRAQM